MNREIKFRAWFEKEKRMIEVNDLVLSGEKPKGYWKDKGMYGNSTIVMQYTGLTDKEGVEVYEGDIVLANGIESVLDYDFSEARKYVSPTIQDSRHFEKRRSEYKVYWQDNFLQFSFMSLSEPKHSINSDVSKREVEVIGNIFQNPELLNQK